MSLNWQITQVENWEELWEPVTEEEMSKDMISTFRENEDGSWSRLNAITQSLIFRTMAVGIGDITKKTAPEFYARSVIFERLFNSFLIWQDGKKQAIRMEDVQRHIGLSTNVAYETAAKWSSRTMKSVNGDLIYDYKKWLDKIADLASIES
jgi:hypothetical protein